MAERVKEPGMKERAYTVAEIERMRRAIEHEWLFGKKISAPDPNAVSGVDANGNLWGGTSTMSRSYMEEEKTKCTEELLRTYMLAGVDPADLE